MVKASTTGGAFSMSRMRNLTLASAKHLMNMGHITASHHARIVSSQAPKAKRAAMAQPFGSLRPQQAQAPIPGAAPSQAIPAGTASGYDE